MNKPEYLAQADRAYYEQGKPIMTDFEYDQLKEQAEAGNIGDDRTEGFPKYRHATKLLSLDNTYNKAELAKFVANVEAEIPDVTFAVEDKIDGLALTAIYDAGKLKTLATRGNGSEGDNVTANSHLFTDLPTSIKYTGYVEVRGEGVMETSEFERINAELDASGQELYANPRNLASGTLKSLDIEPGERKLRFIAYRVVGLDNDLHQDDIKWIKEHGFATESDALEYKASEVIAAIDRIDARRATLSFPTDGAVVKVSSKNHQEARGESSKAPKWGVAYKFKPEEVETVIASIDLQVGRDGRITPVANLNPVQLAGTTVKRATLHNFAEIQRKDIRVGTTVLICKAGEIIPAVTRVIKHAESSEQMKKPTVCPACGSPVMHKVNTDGTETVHLYCTNHACPEQVIGRMRNFVKKKSLDIDGFGDVVTDAVVRTLGITDIFDIYKLTEEELLKIEGFGKGKAKNLLVAIEASRKAPTYAILTSIGVPHIGTSIGKRIILDVARLGEPGYFRSRLNDIRGLHKSSLAAIDAWLHITYNQEQLVKASNTFNPDDSAGGIKSTKLTGKTFVLTGTLPTWSREEATAFILSHSGTMSGSVTKKTSYLLLGTEPGSKYTKAVELGTPIISEDELKAYCK